MEYLLSGSSHGFPTWKFQATWNWETLAHFLHLNGFSPVWVLLCFFKWPAIEKLLSHLEHLKGYSPVWVLSCSFKEFDVEKTCHTLRTWIELFLSGSSHGFQVTWCKEEVRFREALVTLRAFERFLPCVGPLMFLKVVWFREALVTLAPSRNLTLKNTLCT